MQRKEPGSDQDADDRQGEWQLAKRQREPCDKRDKQPGSAQDKDIGFRHYDGRSIPNQRPYSQVVSRYAVQRTIRIADKL